MRLGHKLMLCSLGLLALPWLGYEYLQDLRNFLLKGQEHAQLLSAQGIASFLKDRDDLFATPESQAKLDEQDTLFVFPLNYFIQVDGYKSDWGEIIGYSQHYGADYLIEGEGHYNPQSFAFDLVLGQRSDRIYGYLQVLDDNLAYREPADPRLGAGDHVRLAIEGANHRIERYIVALEGTGSVNVFEIDDKWRTTKSDRPIDEIHAYIQETSRGYDVEFEVPTQLVDGLRRMHISVANAAPTFDDENALASLVLGTRPKNSPRALNPIQIRSAELENVIKGLKREGASIWIVDRLGRVLTHVTDRIYFGRPAKTRTESAIRQALRGSPATQKYISGYSGEETILAAHPIRSGGKIVAAVLVELGIDEIIALQRATLEKSAATTAIVFLTLVTGLLLFAARLTWRIRQLRDETSTAIDAKGRVTSASLNAGTNAKDEIGELSRSISAILSRMRRYTRFLEKMPRTLKHELNNPLNAISTSLQMIDAESDNTKQRPYLESAQRGVAKISTIVESLTDAANLEEALKHENLQTLNLSNLLDAYLQNCRRLIPERTFELAAAPRNILINGNDFRIEQLLDKLVDNAVEFSPKNSAIEFGLIVDANNVMINVTNIGPAIPNEVYDQIFDSLVTYNHPGRLDSKSHLGIGLYIARAITEHHGGQITAANKTDRSGVVISVRLPVAAQNETANETKRSNR